MVLRWRQLLRRPRRLPTVGIAVTARHIAGRTVSYAPSHNEQADPGEVVWTRVAYEENPFESKDRPVLIVGRRDERTVLALMLSSQPDRDGRPHWYPLGVGPWDAKRRPSWVRLDRVLEVHDTAVRREACRLGSESFNRVAALLKAHYGWK